MRTAWNSQTGPVNRAASYLPVSWTGADGADTAASADIAAAPPSLQAPPSDAVLRTLLDRALRTPRARKLAYAVLSLELAVVIGFAIVYRPFDLSIYLWGGHAVTEGSRLYLAQASANWFTYPPFAAALFTPLAGLPASRRRSWPGDWGRSPRSPGPACSPAGWPGRGRRRHRVGRGVGGRLRCSSPSTTRCSWARSTCSCWPWC